jgi:cell division septation protein DedD
MLLFSGVFFTLGYVMGRSQFDSQVGAAPPQPSRAPSDASHPVKSGPGSKPSASGGANANPGDAAGDQAISEWEFYKAGSSKPASDHLTKPASSPKTVAASGSAASASVRSAPAASKTAAHAPLIAGGAYVLQVAALTKQADALVLAGSLQKKEFPAFVLTPTADHFYRVQVGPYADAQSADAAKKGLETAGFKAILKK